MIHIQATQLFWVQYQLRENKIYLPNIDSQSLSFWFPWNMDFRWHLFVLFLHHSVSLFHLAKLYLIPPLELLRLEVINLHEIWLSIIYACLTKVHLKQKILIFVEWIHLKLFSWFLIITALWTQFETTNELHSLAWQS